VERADRTPLGTFYAPGPWSGLVELDEAASHHASVKRLKTGDPVRLTGGDGRRASGAIAELDRRRCVVALDGHVEEVPAPSPIELWAPIGDRERMLLLGEKATELGLSTWRSVSYRRSRSVSPRGEGTAFTEKLRLRMISALEQSGGAWLPAVAPEVPLETALATALTASDGVRLLLDPAGDPVASLLPSSAAHLVVALGPEGGLDADERDAFAAAGWRSASLGGNVLRFETAAIAALAIARALIR
jgi:16S rRNA (uracil1498-N3)-methyltransferase